MACLEIVASIRPSRSMELRCRNTANTVTTSRLAISLTDKWTFVYIMVRRTFRVDES